MLRSTSASLFRAAVLLHGNGVYDGTETTEAVSLLVALSRQGADVACFAPSKPQMHAVNHLTGEEEPQTRDVLAESARIARGSVRPLADLKAADHDALFVPGGFGAAKNLSDFAGQGAEMTVDADVSAALKSFNGDGKYIGLCCIAPVLAASVFGTAAGGPGVTLTLGGKSGAEWPFAGAAEAAEAMGNTVAECDTAAGEAVHDAANKIVTAPAYMKGTAKPHEVFDSVSAMVDVVAKNI